MKVEIIETGPLGRDILVGVPDESVETETKRALNSLRGRVKVKGFRPGKVPMRELNRRYGTSVRRDVVQNLIRKGLSEALQREDLESVVYIAPPEVVEDSGEGGFEFSFKAEVKPEITPKGYIGLSLEVPERPVDDAEVDAEIASIRQRHAVIEPVLDRDKAEDGDTVMVSYHPVDLEDPPAMLVAQDAAIDLGNEHLLEGFKGGVVGLAVGEDREIEIVLPEGSPLIEKTGDAKVRMHITLHGIKMRVLPDLDDDFAQLAMDVDTVDELRNKIQEGLQEQRSNARQHQARHQLEESLLGATDFEMPAQFLTNQIEDEMRRRVMQMQQQGFSLEQLGMTEADLREQVTKAVEHRMRLEFILREIAKREKVTVSDEEVQSSLEQFIQSAGPQGEQLRQSYRNPMHLEGLKERLLVDKTLDFLLSRATILGEGELKDVDPEAIETSKESSDNPDEAEGSSDNNVPDTSAEE